VETERKGLARYLGALRDHWLLIVVLVVVAVAGAAAYAESATPRYDAEADVLVTPIADGDTTFIGFGLLRGGADPTNAVLTAARLVKTPVVADRVARQLGLPGRGAALGSVTVTPLGQDLIVAITGHGSTGVRAAQLANAFATQLVATRTQEFQSDLAARVKTLRGQLARVPAAERSSSPTAIAIGGELASLESLVGSRDPTLRVFADAVPPTSPAWPHKSLSVAVAFLAALLLGAAIAIGLELVSPRINREDELLLGHRLPILARVPLVQRQRIRAYLTGREPLPPSVRESYRTLRSALAGNAGHDIPRTILVTSAIPGEAKTMTSVNLAIALSLGGQRVILVDGDLRRPMVATMFGIPTTASGLADVLVGDVAVEDAVLPAPGHGSELRLLLARPEHAAVVDLLSPHRVEDLLAQLRLEADVVVVDSPPLTEVSDALALADAVDAVIVAVRLGASRRDKLAELRRMLSQRGITPVGFVVTMRRRARSQSAYYGTGEALELPAPRRGTADGNGSGAPPAGVSADRREDDPDSI
jgi:tyrosine-protein kinase